MHSKTIYMDHLLGKYSFCAAHHVLNAMPIDTIRAPFPDIFEQEQSIQAFHTASTTFIDCNIVRHREGDRRTDRDT